MKSKNTSSKTESREANGSSKRAHSEAVKGSSRNQSQDTSLSNSDIKTGASSADAKMLRAWETISKNRGETKGARG